LKTEPPVLRYLHGDAINMAAAEETVGLKLSNIEDYARGILAMAD
jgi:hypothetical protein